MSGKTARRARRERPYLLESDNVFAATLSAMMQEYGIDFDRCTKKEARKVTDEERLVELWAEGRRGPHIAKEIGWDVWSVYLFAVSHRELCPARYNKLTKDEKAAVVDMLGRGYTVSYIAAYIGVTTSAIYRYRRKLAEEAKE